MASNKIINMLQYYPKTRSYSDIYNDIFGRTALDYNGAKTLYHDAVYANHIDGDFAECGCWLGGSSFLLASVIRHDKKLFVLDSFKGLSKPTEEDLNGLNEKFFPQLAEGRFAVNRDEVAKYIASSGKDIIIVEGYFEDTLVKSVDPVLSDSVFSLVHIDVDLCDPYRQAMDFFYPRLVTGGVMIFDEYMFIACKNVQKVIDDFLKTIQFDGFQYGNRLTIIKR